MAQAAPAQWTADEFFAWDERQAERHELVGGFPRMMAGASNVHDRIVVNLIRELSIRLKGSRCRPFTGDGAVETFAGQIRRPDAGVDCGAFEPDSYKASEPRMVAEVLSPSTRDFDAFGKLAEYQALRTLDYILVVEPNAPEVALWSRGADRAWEMSRIEGLERAVAMPALGLELPLGEIYDGVSFPLGRRPSS